MKNRRFLLDSEHHFTMIQDEMPAFMDDEVVVKIMSNGICGSDIHFFHEGKLGNFRVTSPYTPGHECSGIITETGSAVTTFKAGDRVVIEPGIPCGHCGYCKSGRYNLCKDVVFLSAPPINGTFCDYVAIRSDMVYKIPNTLSFERAALAEPTAVAVHAVNRACCANGSTGVIVGAGPIGLLTLQAFKATGGGKAICVDVIDERLEIARRVGADETINTAKYEGSLENLGDVVFETAGNSKTTEMLFKLARSGGKVVQVGWPEKNEVELNIANLLDKELEYIGVNRYANAYAAAVGMIADRKINADEMITQTFDFEDTAKAFQFAYENPKKVLKVVVNN
jgi:L-iditol 2-dehydrogenase